MDAGKLNDYTYYEGYEGEQEFNEVTGPFDADEPCLIDVKEYLDDAIKYRDQTMDYEETPNVLEALINWLNEHADVEVFASVD